MKKIIFAFFLISCASSAFCAELKVYVDPYCPYCKRLLNNYEQINGYYDFDVVWAPVLGERSVQYVQELFRCSNPYSKEVIGRVIKGRLPGCEGDFKNGAWRANMEDYLAASPPYVPMILLDGHEISWGDLKADMRKEQRKLISDNESGSLTKLNWSRYSVFLNADNKDSDDQLSPALLFVKGEIDPGIIKKVRLDGPFL